MSFTEQLLPPGLPVGSWGQRLGSIRKIQDAQDPGPAASATSLPTQPHVSGWAHAVAGGCFSPGEDGIIPHQGPSRGSQQGTSQGRGLCEASGLGDSLH